MSSRNAQPGTTRRAQPGVRTIERQRVEKRIVLRQPISAMVVNEPGLGSSADGESEEGIERSFQRAGASLDLGEQKPSLERGEHRGGEVVRVDVGREFPVGVKGSQSIADGGCPLIDPVRAAVMSGHPHARWKTVRPPGARMPVQVQKSRGPSGPWSAIPDQKVTTVTCRPCRVSSV